MKVKPIPHSTFHIQPRTRAGMCGRELGVEHWLLKVPGSVLIFTIRLYCWTVSPLLVFLCGPAGGCRFTPSCSQYAVDAIRSQGVLAGTGLAVRRICRCHPWGDGGHDPAPPKEFRIPDSGFRI